MTSTPRQPMRRWSRRAAVAAGVVALTATGTSPTAFGEENTTAKQDATKTATATAGSDSSTQSMRRWRADETLEPVKLGFIDQVSGGIVTPEVGAAVEAMVNYFNAELGGIDNHPLELALCTTDDTPEGAAACAQQFASDASVHLVMESTTNPSAIADVLTPVGKPLIAGGVDMGNMLRPGVFVMEPGGAGIAQALFSHAASDVGITNLTVFLADDPAILGMQPMLEHIANTAGMTVNAFVPLPLDEPDYTSHVSSGISPESDGLAFVVAPHQCAPAGSAVQSLDVDLPVVVAELCLTGDVVSSGFVDGWYAGTQSVAPIANGRGEVLQIKRILRSYGDGAERGGFAGLGIGFTWVARDVLIEAGAGEATDEAVMSALSSYSSSDVLGFDWVGCPGPGSFFSACNTSVLMVQVQDREVHDVGGFVKADFSIFEELLG